MTADNNKNDLSDFLLKEYENVAKAFFNSYEIAAKWVRYYLIILAAPFSFLALLYHDQGIDLFNLPNSFAILIFLIGLLNILVSYIIVDLRLDSILYARTVNGVRKYFVDHSGEKLDDYILLPTDITKPHFFKCNNDLFVLTVFMSIINSIYVAFGAMQIVQFKDVYSKCLSSAVFFWAIFILCLIIHYLISRTASNNKQKMYCEKTK